MKTMVDILLEQCLTRSTTITTTLWDLMTAIHSVVESGEDRLVIAATMDLLNSDRHLALIRKRKKREKK